MLPLPLFREGEINHAFTGSGIYRHLFAGASQALPTAAKRPRLETEFVLPEPFRGTFQEWVPLYARYLLELAGVDLLRAVFSLHHLVTVATLHAEPGRHPDTWRRYDELVRAAASEAPTAQAAFQLLRTRNELYIVTAEQNPEKAPAASPSRSAVPVTARLGPAKSQPDTRTPSAARASPREHRGPEPDLCRRFNRAQGCPDGTACRYKHGCTVCRSASHGATHHGDAPEAPRGDRART
eukprot:m.17898 g.17898  ORF g.17898 m.17898 type:complete len:239 (-) comp3286_c0_seq2:48-764(-)